MEQPKQNSPTNVFDSAQPKKKIVKKKSKFLKIFLSIFLFLFLSLVAITVFFTIFGYLPAKKVYSRIVAIKSKQDQLKNVVSSKNLDLIEQEITNLDKDLSDLASDYSKLKLVGSLPYLKDYYQDGNLLIDIGHQSISTGKIIINAIKPYQDFLGLQAQATSSADTTQDRITFLTESIESLLPNLDTIEQNIAKIKDDALKIDSTRYPEEYKGIQIKSNIVKAQNSLEQVHSLIKDGKPMLQKVSWLLGKDSPKKYFLLFQNDAELRPSGGFWTAYGILKVSNGKITPVVSDDIYSLDEKLKSTIPAPRPIKSYHINVPYWYIRDMNISPDFATNAKTFLEYYNKISKEKFDAIIAIDTNVLVDLVDILGRIGVPQYGNFSSDPDKRCYGCPQIIYELEYIAGKPRSYIVDNRKGFLAPLMHSILANAMGSPKEKITPLAKAFFSNIYQKHIIFYFLDEEMQKAADLANITGAIKTTNENTDYFHLNDANMASAKTNLFIEQKIKHQIITNGDQVEHKITISYTNPYKASNCNLEKGDLCLNAPKYRDWFRFYTPTGSKLVQMTGSEVEPLQYEELGKQVFEGFYGDKYPLYEKSSNKVTVQYISSVKASKNYQLLLQKQAGTKPVQYLLVVNGKEAEQFEWNSDKTIKLPL